MTTMTEPTLVRRRTRRPSSDPQIAELDTLIARNPGWFDELSAEKRRLLGDAAEKILGA